MNIYNKFCCCCHMLLLVLLYIMYNICYLVLCFFFFQVIEHTVFLQASICLVAGVTPIENINIITRKEKNPLNSTDPVSEKKNHYPFFVAAIYTGFCGLHILIKALFRIKTNWVKRSLEPTTLFFLINNENIVLFSKFPSQHEIGFQSNYVNYNRKIYH